jgi:hypothetical protein
MKLPVINLFKSHNPYPARSHNSYPPAKSDTHTLSIKTFSSYFQPVQNSLNRQALKGYGFEGKDCHFRKILPLKIGFIRVQTND